MHEALSALSHCAALPPDQQLPPPPEREVGLNSAGVMVRGLRTEWGRGGGGDVPPRASLGGSHPGSGGGGVGGSFVGNGAGGGGPYTTASGVGGGGSYAGGAGGGAGDGRNGSGSGGGGRREGEGGERDAVGTIEEAVRRLEHYGRVGEAAGWEKYLVRKRDGEAASKTDVDASRDPRLRR